MDSASRLWASGGYSSLVIESEQEWGQTPNGTRKDTWLTCNLYAKLRIQSGNSSFVFNLFPSGHARTEARAELTQNYKARKPSHPSLGPSSASCKAMRGAVLNEDVRVRMRQEAPEPRRETRLTPEARVGTQQQFILLSLTSLSPQNKWGAFSVGFHTDVSSTFILFRSRKKRKPII